MSSERTRAAKMNGAITQPWGKLKTDEVGNVVAWHPLVDHCADVAAVCECLLADVVIRRRFARLSGLDDLLPVLVARLCFLAAMHDAGKVNHGFQRKAAPGARDVEGHVAPVFEALFSDHPELTRLVRNALRVDLVLDWKADHLLYASLAHHGRPINVNAAGNSARPALWAEALGHDPVHAMEGLAQEALRWFPAALEEAPPFPDAPALSHAFAGLVTWADWIASDASLFPFSEPGSPPRMHRARDLARHALDVTGIAADPLRMAMRGDFQFLRAFPGCLPRPAQARVLNLPLPREGSLVVLESETGSGKTEAALSHFFRLLAAGEVDGLYFALPTRTAATQLHARVEDAVARIFPGPERPPVIRAVPGYLPGHGEASPVPRLASPAALWPDELADRERWRAWASERPKRYLAGAIAVGTIDQVLLSALAAKHAHLRASALLRQLLVVDEVHASDTYMNGLLEVVLERHRAAGGHALLMSATLGSATRERLTVRGRPPRLEQAMAVPYPAVSVIAGEQRTATVFPVVPPGPGQEAPKHVRVDLEVGARSGALNLARVVDAARAGARVLVIRNKVADAVRAQLDLESSIGDAGLLFACDGIPAPHHSRFAREDRVALDASLEAAFGKARSGPGRVVIATQTVQQALDLDADLLVTDLCPMDVLLQRLGRLHRHAREARPSGYIEPRCVVLVPDQPLGQFLRRDGTARGPLCIGTVYEDLRVLEATRQLLADRHVLDLPAMNRELVEATTHPEALEALAKNAGSAWVQHHAWCLSVSIARANGARSSVFRWAEPYGERGFAPELEAAAVTRLGVADRVAEFPRPFRSPFCRQVRELTVPGWMASGVPADPGPVVVGEAMSVGGVSFRFGNLNLVYDRLGLRRAEQPPAQSEEEAGID